MATKAQAFRTQQARTANPPKPKQPKRPRRDLVIDTAQPGVSATDRKLIRGSTDRAHAGRRGGAALEEVAVGQQPSRKSTRKSADRTKRTTNLQLKASRASAAPTARATRGAATTEKARAQAKPTAPAKRPPAKRPPAKRPAAKRPAAKR